MGRGVYEPLILADVISEQPLHHYYKMGPLVPGVVSLSFQLFAAVEIILVSIFTLLKTNARTENRAFWEYWG